MGRNKPASRLLSSGRPPTFKKAKSISRKETRTLINTHHTLQKKRQQALARNDEKEAAAIAAEISALGGLEEYQRASLQGQRVDRGGDSSRVLLDWLRSANLQPSKATGSGKDKGDAHRRLRMLEVGALSTDNACSKSGLFEMELIDLNSQQAGILQQDFMERPLPQGDSERFDIISLSLVLNYVPDHSLRGQMLLRTLSFLRQPGDDLSESARALFPSLFVVLPRSCIANSRYFSQDRLVELMTLLGYVQLEGKVTNKLAYSFWQRATAPRSPLPPVAKKELNPGLNRNNFTITLKGS
ncbi:25S rRNA (adenine(2142)-N(1))-methyltransferase [Colletotrichum spaethianum]|uniref:25S rRNA adenine-N(1) methyltransferase n=1 Tax=Colletotrichum spaethianum TaxID=700344 RepID=A0AA37LCH0_9PEZI|nr:25S rRNA (adenine(2142)-N(1))-methyltransferase [Colletotrichum spaethianum]GKT43803.1 25S rRNA (adenine(2142)-N(1))-methyltransferase [Colletotrichum spaethianum]